MFSDALIQQASHLLEACRAQHITLSFAESCTGGLLGGLLTHVPGASDVVERGFITYSNQAKIDMLGVNPDTIHNFGAVSKETALAMAEGALLNSQAGRAVSITGIAGPDGGIIEKPIGLVWFGLAIQGQQGITHYEKFGNLTREKIRLCAVEQALHLLAAGL